MAQAEHKTNAREDILASLRDYRPVALTTASDQLDERYQVQLNQPLPQYTNAYVTGYPVTDTEHPGMELNAAVFKGLPPRIHKIISTFTEIRHPSLLSVLAEGSIATGNGKERRYAVVYERPSGPSMQQVMQEKQTALPESLILYHVITPIAEIIKLLETHGTRHGRIHVSNLYTMDDKMMLGEAISEPPSLSIPFTSDSVEQLLSNPEYKGENNISADCYALGVMALQLLIGPKKLTNLDKKEFLEKILEQGSYQVLTQDHDFSPQMQDFFRGIFHDNALHRWDADTILRWAAGKRFHILHPPAASESTRPFSFLGHNYWSYRALAHAVDLNWNKAKEIFENDRLVRWADASLRKAEGAEAISRVIIRAGLGDTTRREKAYDESVARLIMTLDPTGPIRFMGLSFRYDSIAEMLAKAMRDNHDDEIQAVIRMIDSDLVSSLAEVLKDKAPPDLDSVIKNLQNVRPFIRSNVFGSGPERCLYDLNSDLACQSPRLQSYSISDLHDLLIVLDGMAPQLAATEEVLDRHSAAFIASKLNMRADPRVPALVEHPSLASDPRMIALHLIVTAARKTGQRKLPGLAHWLAVGIAPLFDKVHNRKMRDSMRNAFIITSKEGRLDSLAKLVFDPTFLTRDEKHYREVERWYNSLSQQIEYCRHPEVHRFHATRLSRWFAQAVSAGTCASVIYATLKYYLLL